MIRWLQKQQTLQGNIWKYAVYAATNKRIYMTFLTIFLLTMPSATARTIGLLTLVAQIAGIIFEVPSGYFSDRIGHARALVIGRAAMALSTGLYIFADQVWYFFVATVLLSLGWAFESGTSSAFMHETLSALGRDKEYAHIMGRIKSLGFAVPVVLIVIVAAIADSNFRIAFLFAFIIDLIGLGATLLFKQPKKQQSTGELEFENIVNVLKSFVRIKWLPYVISTTLLFGIVLGTTIGFKNPYQEILGFSITMLGVLWALSRVLISILLLANGWIQRHFSFKQFLLLEAGIVALALLGVGLTTNMWVVAALFIISGVPMWGVMSAREHYYLSFLKGSDSKATLLSIKELINKLFIGIVGVIMGLMVVDVGFQNAYLVVSGALLMLVVGVTLFVPRIAR